jgi:hypothetical protein
MRFAIFALVAAPLFMLGAAGEAHAQDFVGARALALSEAYRAIATGNDAIYMNPAGLTQIPKYSPELHYLFNLDDQNHELDVSVVDSKTSPLAAGLGYTFQGREFTKRATLQHTATLALAYPIIPTLFSVGVGLKYVNITDAFVGNYLNALSGDLGLLATIPGGISVAAVGYNLIPIKSTDVPLSAAFAAAIDLGPLSDALFGGAPTTGMVPDASGTPKPVGLVSRGPLAGLTLSVDWQISFFTVARVPQSRISTGLEYLLLDCVPLRAGYQWDEGKGDHLVSVGAGFIVPYFGFDVAYQQSVVRPTSRNFASAVKFFIDF